MTATGFDLERFLKTTRRVQVEDLAWESVRDHPLKAGEARFLTYMMNIESHTIVYLRDLLGTSAVEDPEVTAFLSCWAYEEFFHGHYLERFLAEYAGPHALRNSTRERLSRVGRVTAALKRVASPVLAAASPDFAATHMAWGAAQEYTTLHGYEALSRQSGHPVLKELLARIVKDERRHFAFYRDQARRRLTRSRVMRAETRLLMDRLWRPVGADVMPPAELDFIAWFLFRDEEGMRAVRHVDETIAALPGMDGWTGLMDEVSPAIARQERRGAGEAARAAAVMRPVAPAARSRVAEPTLAASPAPAV